MKMKSVSEATTGQRINALQGLRGFAILCIMVSHSFLLTDDAGRGQLGYLGGLGVECFLLLSGYLSCYWHLEQGIPVVNLIGSIKYGIGKMRRYYRLHIVTLLLALPFAWKGLFREDSVWAWAKLLLNALLLQDWVPIESVYFSYNAVSWYLSLMLFILIVTPWVLRVLAGLDGKQMLLVLVGIVIVQWIVAGLCRNSDLNIAVAHWLVYICPLVRLGDFAFGGGIYILIGKTKFDCKSERAVDLIGFISIAVIGGLMICSVGADGELFSVAVWTIPCGCLLASLTMERGIMKRIFNCPQLILLGDVSFELFLIHQLVIRYCATFGQKIWAIDNLGFTGSAIALGLAVLISTAVFRAGKS